MPDLITTPGAADANSYADLDDAFTYNDAHTPTAAWTAATDDVQASALAQACRLLDASFRWTGAAATATQALTWPRLGMLSRNGFPIDPATVPQALKDAQCEFARQLVAFGDRTDDNLPERLGISSVKAGPVAVSYRAPGGGSGSLDLRNADVLQQGPDFDWLWKAVPVAVRNLLPPDWYVRKTVSLPIFLEASR